MRKFAMKQGYMLVSKKGYMVVLPKVDDGVKAGVGASVEERVGTAGRGRNRPYKKRYSHIKIVVTDEIQNIVAKTEKLGSRMKQNVEKVIEENTEVVASKQNAEVSTKTEDKNEESKKVDNKKGDNK